MDEEKTEAHLLAFVKGLKTAGQSHVPMGTLITSCDQKTIFPLLLALSLLTLIPLIATPAGILSALFYWQMLTSKAISSSSWLGRRPVSLDVVSKAIDRFNRLERIWGSYFPTFLPKLCLNSTLFKLHACYGLFCSMGVITPIPGINYLFGPSLLFLSLALVHTNGLLILMTYLLLPIQGAALFYGAKKIIALIA